jgi:hypothetical protein
MNNFGVLPSYRQRMAGNIEQDKIYLIQEESNNPETEEQEHGSIV